MIPFRLDYVIERMLQASGVADGQHERQMIKDLTGVRLPKSNARKVWSSILEHKWYLGERPNRDVGLRTAAIDYIENFAPIPGGLANAELNIVSSHSIYSAVCG